MTVITDNSTLLEGKPRQSFILRDIVERINSIIQTELIDPVDDLEKQISILTATGIWLDYIGNKILYPRPQVVVEDVIWFGFDEAGFGFDQSPFAPTGADTVGIDDESYRMLLVIRGAQLLTDGSIPSMSAIVDAAFGEGKYIDNGNMSIDVVIDDSLSDIIIAAIVKSGLITKPAGVRINQISIKHTSGTFGFDGVGPGFDQAPFIRTFEDLLQGALNPTFLIDDAGNNLTDEAGNLLTM